MHKQRETLHLQIISMIDLLLPSFFSSLDMCNLYVYESYRLQCIYF